MNATSLLVSTTRLVLQADARGVDDPSTLSDLYRLVPYLRQSLSCTVCGQLLREPFTPQAPQCQHHVCRGCLGGRKNLKPACQWCRDYQKYEINNQLRILLQCYRSLCEYIVSKPQYRHVICNAAVASNASSTATTLPASTTSSAAANSSSNNPQAQHNGNNGTHHPHAAASSNAASISLLELIEEGARFKDNYKSNSGQLKCAYSMLPCVYNNVPTATASIPPAGNAVGNTNAAASVIAAPAPVAHAAPLLASSSSMLQQGHSSSQLPHQTQHQQQQVQPQSQTSGLPTTSSRMTTKIVQIAGQQPPIQHPTQSVPIADVKPDVRLMNLNMQQRAQMLNNRVVQQVRQQQQPQQLQQQQPQPQKQPQLQPVQQQPQPPQQQQQQRLPGHIRIKTTPQLNSLQKTYNTKWNRPVSITNAVEPAPAASVPGSVVSTIISNPTTTTIATGGMKAVGLQPTTVLQRQAQPPQGVHHNAASTSYSAVSTTAPIKTVSNGSAMYSVMYAGTGNKITIKRKTDASSTTSAAAASAQQQQQQLQLQQQQQTQSRLHPHPQQQPQQQQAPAMVAVRRMPTAIQTQKAQATTATQQQIMKQHQMLQNQQQALAISSQSATGGSATTTTYLNRPSQVYKEKKLPTMLLTTTTPTSVGHPAGQQTTTTTIRYQMQPATSQQLHHQQQQQQPQLNFTSSPMLQPQKHPTQSMLFPNTTPHHATAAFKRPVPSATSSPALRTTPTFSTMTGKPLASATSSAAASHTSPVSTHYGASVSATTSPNDISNNSSGGSSSTNSSTTSATSASSAAAAAAAAKRKGCRCGNATPTPGKLTCCGQRCPCYVDAKSCVDCKCRGCRNPHRADGFKIRPHIPELDCIDMQLPDSEAGLTTTVALRGQQAMASLQRPTTPMTSTATTSNPSPMGTAGASPMGTAVTVPLNRFTTMSTSVANSTAAAAAAATLNRNNTTLTYMPATTSAPNAIALDAASHGLSIDPDSIIFNPNDLDDTNNFQVVNVYTTHQMPTGTTLNYSALPATAIVMQDNVQSYAAPSAGPSSLPQAPAVVRPTNTYVFSATATAPYSSGKPQAQLMARPSHNEDEDDEDDEEDDDEADDENEGSGAAANVAAAAAAAAAAGGQIDHIGTVIDYVDEFPLSADEYIDGGGGGSSSNPAHNMSDSKLSASDQMEIGASISYNSESADGGDSQPVSEFEHTLDDVAIMSVDEVSISATGHNAGDQLQLQPAAASIADAEENDGEDDDEEDDDDDDDDVDDDDENDEDFNMSEELSDLDIDI